MERLEELIGKLKEQSEQRADHEQLLLTTQMIQSELHRLMKPSVKPSGSSKVSVVMPAARNHASSLPTITTTTVAPPEPRREVPTPPNHEKYQPPVTEAELPPVLVEHIEEQVEALEEHPPVQSSNGWHFDPVKDIPTLAHQETFKELNEVIGIKNASLNDKLKEEVIEVGHRLTDSPIRDLKRAIGINDRYSFINELFRGDEAMYERSLKTINGFRIYAEAEYWIERELKVKLGWEENKHVTRHFYQLIRRRFS